MDGWDDFDEDEDEARRPFWRRKALWLAVAAVIVAIVAVAAVRLNKDDATSTSAEGLSSVVDTSPAGGTVTSGPAPAGTADAASAAAGGSAPASSPTATSTTTAATTTTLAPTTTAAVVTAATTTVPPALASTYSTLPDGSPAPIIAVFGTDNITITGAVPTPEAKDTLQGLALANSKFPVPVNNLLTIDPSVPIGIGVRVVELTSARFDPGSSVVSGLHALELDRVVSVMNALPNVTALVIGHADQIGSDAKNFKTSADRAAAVVNYMVSKGVSPSRLASRAVGENDLLTLNDDAASLALNRRTEFVLYGLLGA